MKSSTFSTALVTSTTRKYNTASTFMVTLSLVITSCGSSIIASILVSTLIIRSTIGTMKLIPGFLTTMNRPKRSNTPLSHWRTTLTPLEAKPRAQNVERSVLRHDLPLANQYASGLVKPGGYHPDQAVQHFVP